jgi:hypothetical protein
MKRANFTFRCENWLLVWKCQKEAEAKLCGQVAVTSAFSQASKTESGLISGLAPFLNTRDTLVFLSLFSNYPNFYQPEMTLCSTNMFPVHLVLPGCSCIHLTAVQ